VRENDGVQLGFRFKFVVFCLGLFFLCFLCFRRSGPPALRVEGKTPKKSARAPLYTRRWPRLYRLACLSLSGLPSRALAVGHSAQNVTSCLKISTTSHPRAWLCFWLVGYAISISLYIYAQYVKYHTKNATGLPLFSEKIRSFPPPPVFGKFVFTHLGVETRGGHSGGGQLPVAR
jgi:hypothetical protein